MNLRLNTLIIEERKKTEKLVIRAERELKRLPEGTLEKKVMRKKYLQFFHVFNEGGNRVVKYIPKKNRKLAEIL